MNPAESARRFLLALVLLAGTPSAVLAQDAPPAKREPAPASQRAPEPGSEPMEPPAKVAAVATALEAPYLKPDEAKDLRVFFGTADPVDMDTPARKARWALQRGAYLDPALAAPDAPLLDRAEALLWQGKLDEVTKLIEADSSMRAVRLRVSAYEQLGRFDIAIASSVPAREYLAAGKFTNAVDVADATRAIAIATRLRAPIGEPGAEHQALMAALKQAREQVDRLSWPVYLAEAELLHEKDNSSQSQQALQQVLGMNPMCAEAWALLGKMACEAFDMGSVEAIAVRLDALASAVKFEQSEDAPPAGEVGKAPEGEKGGEAQAKPPLDDEPIQPASLLAASLRIRAMLRQNDPDQAQTLSAGAFAAYPDSRVLAELKCAIAALRFDDKVLDEALDDYDKRSARSGRALYEAGRAMSEARQYGRASDLLKRAAARMPHWPQPLIDLGLLYIQSGQDDDARDVFKDAREMDPFNVRADNSMKLLKEVATYERAESDHFIVRYRPIEEGTKDQPSADATLAHEMLAVLEDNHRRVTGSPEKVTGGIEYSPPTKTFIDLMPNHRWFAVRIAGMPKIHTIAASTGPIIAMEAPREGQSHSGTYDWPRVLRHEYTHTVGLGKTNNRLPHWFTEAQAVFLELSPRDYQTVQLLTRTFEKNQLFDFVEINAAFVRPKKPTDRQLAYAQGHWMYEYLFTTFGDRSPLKLMELYAQGVREEEAYQRVLGISRAQFMDQFKVWAKQQLMDWGMKLKDGEPTLANLLKAEAKRLAGADAPDDTDPAEPTPELVTRLLGEHPEHPDLLELACRQAMEAAGGAPTLAIAPMLERYAKARPVDPMPHKALARLYLGLPDPPATEAGPSRRDAVEHLEWLDAREEKSPAYAAQLATLYTVAGDTEKAYDRALRATRFAPYDARYREAAAAIALQRSDLAGARAQIEAMILLEPDRAIHRQRLEAVKKRMGG